ncbi:thyrotropin subunit beta isoform X3 [Cuculus canorus]|uniref:thyrotropin subunit beta isoform X3 n=1 Tax=Cuculus canorus TaxID=55661 RepID=UPI0023AA8963|nr:thyrotropin subunit beta isoform X3 [Cuculus canorus]
MFLTNISSPAFQDKENAVTRNATCLCSLFTLIEGAARSKYLPSMNLFFVISLLFGLALGQTASLCAPSEYIIHVEKRECAYCLAINTTICAGFCMTRDSNGKKLLLRSALSQNVCTYKEMLYRTALIPGCPHHTIPYYSYPVAVSCKCGKCNTDYSDCVHEKVRTNYCTKPQKLCNM